jgi:glucose-1-phosphate thymidylyltransferase
MTRRAVILAAGMGTRMRREDATARIEADQAAVAATGVKALIPVGRPFLDYVLSGLADVGLTEVCLIIGPAHDAIREYYGSLSPVRLRIGFAVQQAPVGTADAVLAAELWTEREPFLVLNSDNYYPHAALAALAALDEPGTVAFSREGLLRDGQIPPERIASFALLDVDAAGYLRRIVEKPDAAERARLGEAVPVGMNCWRFDHRVFDVCRRVPRSSRGELELPLAAQLAVDEGMAIRAVPFDGSVLDLSSRSDIAFVKATLAGVQVRL